MNRLLQKYRNFLLRHPYWDAYGAYGLALVLFFTAGLVLVAWIFSTYMTSTKSGIFEIIKNMAEPVFVLLGSIVAIIATRKFSSRMGEIRSYQMSMPLEQLEDQSFTPWRSVNHSFSKMIWKPVTNLRSRDHLEKLCIREMLLGPRMNYKFSIGANVIEQLNEETGTDNYRLLGMRKAIYLRIYKSHDEEQIRTMDLVSTYIHDKNIFANRFSQCQIAIEWNNFKSDQESIYKIDGSGAYFPAGTLRDEMTVVRIFPYAYVKYHFQGRKISELESVGGKLGEVQLALSDMKYDPLKNRIKSAQERRINGRRENTPEELSVRLEDISDEVKKSAANVVSGFNTNLCDKIKNVVVDVIKIRGSYPTDTILLHDTHPHNTLFLDSKDGSKRECVLIHDYEWVGNWNHSVVLAFSMHRFVREYVRQHTFSANNSTTESNIHNKIREGVISFLTAYNVIPP